MSNAALAIAPRLTPMEQLLRSLDHPPPYQIGDVPLDLMPMLIADARRVHRRYEAELLAKGWSIPAIYGCDVDRPWARIDRAGVVFFLRDRKIVVIDPDRVVIEDIDGSRLTHRKRTASKFGLSDATP